MHHAGCMASDLVRNIHATQAFPMLHVLNVKHSYRNRLDSAPEGECVRSLACWTLPSLRMGIDGRSPIKGGLHYKEE